MVGRRIRSKANLALVDGGVVRFMSGLEMGRPLSFVSKNLFARGAPGYRVEMVHLTVWIGVSIGFRHFRDEEKYGNNRIIMHIVQDF